MYRSIMLEKPVRRAFLLVGVLVILVLRDPWGAWALTYTFTTIDVPGSLPGSTYVYGINDAGQIVGVFTDIRGQQHNFIKTGDNFSIFDVPNAFSDAAYDINVGGEIVGAFEEFTNSTTQSHGFLYAGGTFTTIDPPGSIHSGAFSINDAGQIVGLFQYVAGGPLHGFLDTGGTFTTIDPPGSTTTIAYGINNAGQIVGGFGVGQGHAQGFLYTGGTFTTIDVPGETQTEAHGINDTGQIVGWFATTPGGVFTGSGGFVYKEGSFTILDVPSSSSTNPQDINNAGQIVGYFYDAIGIHGFLATPETVSFAFTGFFPPISNQPVLNVVQAGRSIPVKFSLNGDQGLNIFATGYPSSQQINCVSDSPLNDVQQTVTSPFAV